MANSKISALSVLTTPAADDVLAIVDTSATETKQISFANLSAGITVGSTGVVQFTGRNETGATILAGTAVYISGHTSETTIARADNGSSATMPAFGIAKEDILNNTDGIVVLTGEIAGLNTTAFTIGDQLYVGSAGALTATRPTGTSLVQKIAKVTKAAAVGEIIVTGAGRSNDIPNITAGSIWQGDATQTAVAVAAPYLTDGTLLIGGTSGPVVTTLTAGTNIAIVEGDGTIAISATSDGTDLELKTRTSAASVAGQAEGVTVTFGTNTGMTPGAVYVYSSADTWALVNATAVATTKGLIAMAMGTTPAAGMLTEGVGYLSHDPGTAGEVLYLDTVTAGYLTSAQSTTATEFVRVAGYCIADNKVYFSPSQDWIEIG